MSATATKSPKIVIIGAGGVVFPLRLMGDMLSFPALQGATYSLMDIDLSRAQRTTGMARELADHYGFPASIDATDNLREALTGANYVIITFQVGGVEAWLQDYKIPLKYGIDQAVGDTLGPGGVFRFLRSVNAYRDIANLIHELCPDVHVINYANPMAMACWYLKELGIKATGLCHSVQGTTRMLARALDVSYEDVTFTSAGINHQAWLTAFRRGNEDLYPRIRDVMTRRHLDRIYRGDLAEDEGDHSRADRGDTSYEGGNESVRTAIMDMFGYFHTESTHHASEYLPYFRKSPELIAQYIPERWGFSEDRLNRVPEDMDRKRLDELKQELKPSLEYGALIVNATETGEPTVIYGNVANDRLIDNLPDDCVVEVACLVDGNGVQPTHYGALPPQCASVNMTNINVQRMAVHAALTGSRAAAEQAVALDPLTSAVLTLDQIRAMTNELMEAHAALLEGVLTS
jgi:alpha-galactosidase